MPYAQQLLHGTDVARLAYMGTDGDPRVVPIAFWTERDRVMMATTPPSRYRVVTPRHRGIDSG